MSQTAWKLIDAETGLHRGGWSLGPSAVSETPSNWSVTFRRLSPGRSDGVDLLEVNNGAARFSLLPTRGMGVWKGACGPIPLGWQSPIRGPVHPKFVPLAEPSGLGWLDGFDELLVRCGLYSNGAPDFDEAGRLRYGLHGRIANTPAHSLELMIDAEAGEIRVCGEVDDARFHFHKLRLRTTWITRFGEPGFRVEDEIINFGGTATGCQLLYHLNLGAPLLQPGAQLLAPIAELVPRDDGAAKGLDDWSAYPTPQPGVPEQCYFARLLGDPSGQTEILLRDPAAAHGLSVNYDIRQLPYFTLWKNPAAAADGYVTGLEPATNLPNTRTFEEQQGRVVQLAAGDTYRSALQLQLHMSAAEVEAAQQRVALIQQQASPQLHAGPLPAWCQGAVS